VALAVGWAVVALGVEGRPLPPPLAAARASFVAAVDAGPPWVRAAAGGCEQLVQSTRSLARPYRLPPLPLVGNTTTAGAAAAASDGSGADDDDGSFAVETGRPVAPPTTAPTPSSSAGATSDDADDDDDDGQLPPLLRWVAELVWRLLTRLRQAAADGAAAAFPTWSADGAAITAAAAAASAPPPLPSTASPGASLSWLDALLALLRGAVEEAAAVARANATRHHRDAATADAAMSAGLAGVVDGLDGGDDIDLGAAVADE
jgi:hypothetical protein